MRRIIVCLLAAALACRGDSGTNPASASIAGTYTLQTVNGAALPATLAQAGTSRTEVMSNTLTMTANATYTAVVAFRTTLDATVTTAQFTESGTWSAEAGSITFRTSDGIVYHGALNGLTLTEINGAALTEPGAMLTFVFVKY